MCADSAPISFFRRIQGIIPYEMGVFSGRMVMEEGMEPETPSSAEPSEPPSASARRSKRASTYILLASVVALGGTVLAFWVGIHAGRALDRHGPTVTVTPTAPPTEPVANNR